MKKQKIRQLIDDLIRDMNSDWPEDRSWMRYLAWMYQKCTSDEGRRIWKAKIDEEIRAREEKIPEYKELIANLIKIYKNA